MRFASAYFDSHKEELSNIGNFDALTRYLDQAELESKFLEFAKRKDGISPSSKEWAIDRKYIMTQLRALVGRYSKLGDNAYYHLVLEIDDCFNAALGSL